MKYNDESKLNIRNVNFLCGFCFYMISTVRGYWIFLVIKCYNNMSYVFICIVLSVFLEKNNYKK